MGLGLPLAIFAKYTGQHELTAYCVEVGRESCLAPGTALPFHLSLPAMAMAEGVLAQ